MGLSINSITVMDGLATIYDLYGHARDIRITKNENKFNIECIFHIYKEIQGNKKHIDSIFISKEYDTDFLTKTWSDIYTLVKEKLDSMNVSYVDII